MRDQDRRIANGTDDGQDVTRIIPPAALANTLRELRESVEAVLDLPVTDPSNPTAPAAAGVRLARMHVALRHLCERAREQKVPAEHLIILVKNAWGHLPTGESLTGKSDQVLTLSELVTACINEFYRGDPATRSGKFANGDARDDSRAGRDRDHR